MAQNEVEFLFKARDEVSRQLAEINRQIEATGVAAGKASRQTSEFTRFIREQRTEQRTQNFLFREGAQALGAVSLGLALVSGASTKASQSTKDLSNSLNSGFLAFQGISFALAGFAPTIGLVAGAVAGLAAVFGTMASNAEDGRTRIIALREDVAKLRLQLGQISEAEFINTFSDGIDKVKKKLVEAREITLDWLSLLLSGGFVIRNRDNTEDILTLQKEQLSRELEIQRVREEAVKKDLEEQKKSAAGIDAFMAKLDEEEAAFKKLFAAVFPLQIQQNKFIQDRIDLYQRLGSASIDAIQKESSLRKGSLSPLSGVEQSELPGIDASLNVLDRMRENFNQLGTLAEQVGDTITNTMTNAAEIMAGVMTGAIDNIGEAFKQLIQLMISELIKIGLLKLFSGLIAGVATGGASVPASIGVGLTGIGKTAVGRVPSEGQTITINIQPEARSVSVADKRRALQVLEAAIFTEK